MVWYTDILFIYNFLGTCPLCKVRGAPFWHVDLFLPPLGMCSILYSEKYSALNLPCFLNVLCNHFKKWMLCIFLKREELPHGIPTVSNSIQRSGRGWLLYLSFGFALWVGSDSGSGGLLELRELDGTEELETAGPEEVGFWDRLLCFLGGPLSLSGSGLSQDDLILMDMVTLAASLETTYDSASQTCTYVTITGGLFKQFPGLSP